MPVYKDNAMNRRLGRVGKKFGKGITTGPDRFLTQESKDNIAKRKEKVKTMGESTRYGKFAKKEETEKTSNWSDKNNTKKESDAERAAKARARYLEFSKEMADIKKGTEPKKKAITSLPKKKEEPKNTKRRKLERITFKGDKKDVPLLIPRGSKHGLKKKKKMAKGKKTKLDEAGVKKGMRKLEKRSRRLSKSDLLFDPDMRSDKNYKPRDMGRPGRPPFGRPAGPAQAATEDALGKEQRDVIKKARLEAKKERERKQRIREAEERLGMTQAEYRRMGRALGY